MSHRPFAELRAAIEADPERRARVDEYRRAMRDAVALAELRAECGVTPEQVATALGVGQEDVSRIERQDDLYLSALGEYVAALGGRLEVNAVFPDRTVTLVGPQGEPGSSSKTAGARRERTSPEATAVRS